jgi:C4-dicarboxylate-specific signal transduction histidine kinase
VTTTGATQTDPRDDELARCRAENERLRAELSESRALLIHLGKLNELGRMTASLIHEINQPLAGIKSFAQMVRRKMTDDDAQLAKVVAIEEQTTHIEVLIDRLRRFSRHADVSREPIDVHGPLESALHLLEYRLRNKAITVERRFAPHLPFVPVNATHLQQVFVNLLVNACDALDGSPDRRIVVATLPGPSAEVGVLVGDSGPGVPPELRDKIFEYFFTTKGEDRGTGIGLAVCREILRVYGGAIELAEPASLLPGGEPPLRTLFSVRLPAETAR